MFSSLRSNLSTIFDKLKRKGVLSELDVQSALREIRIALLEADVALPVVKELVENIKTNAIGQNIIKSIQPTQMVIKIVHDELIKMLGEAQEINVAGRSPFSYLVAGLQGSGKTTTTIKIALYLKKMKKNPLLVSLDIYRPAAQLQLEILAQKAHLPSLPIVEDEKPLEIIKRAMAFAKKSDIDVILFDTAGRLHVDDVLMDELKMIEKATNPLETFLVADSLMGQDAIRMAQSFHEQIKLTSIVLTRLDGDGRGGAALSITHVTKCPIKFLGVGEKIGDLDVFDPKRIADQILDQGDIVGLVQKAAQLVDQDGMEKMAKQMERGKFTLNDMVMCIESMNKMGGIAGILNVLPGAGKIKEQMQSKGMDEKTSEKIIKKQLALVSSMTPKERLDPKILNASRRKRIASGAGQSVEDVNRLIKQFQQMQTAMKHFGGKNLLRMSRFFKK
jgi:signal recognition particle subunit SRP54